VADNLTDVAENLLLDALVGTAAYTATTPIKLALVTVAGSDSAAGTEATGGSYARQTIAFNSAASGSIDNSATVSFTDMPACTVVGIEIFDSAGTPKRLAYGPLAANKTLTAGDTIQFAASAITLSLS
jgi:hypothetical protein